MSTSDCNIPSFVSLDVTAYTPPSSSKRARRKEAAPELPSTTVIRTPVVSDPINPSVLPSASPGETAPASQHESLAPAASRIDELWYRSWRALGGRDDGQGALEQLLAAYHDPSRHAHGINHVLDCFASLKRWQSHARHFHELAIAIWYHDVLHDPQRHDNEARSARLAAEHLSAAGIHPDTVRRIRELVVSTRPGESLPNDDARLLHDIDRVVLASSSETFDRYERNVRYENSHIGDFIYRRKRIETLQTLLSKAQIYVTDYAHEELDAPARANLRRWLQIWQQLAQPVPPVSDTKAIAGHTI